MRQDSIAPVFFKKNRERLAAVVPAHSLILIRGNTLIKRTDGLTYPFHQDTDFYYYTGVDIEDCAILFLTDGSGRIKEEYLFHPETDNLELVWTGRVTRLIQILHSNTFNSFHTILGFKDKLNDLLTKAKHLVSDEKPDYLLAKSLTVDSSVSLKQAYSKIPLKEYSTEQRAIKQVVEVALMRRSCLITAEGFKRLANKIAVGTFEYELEACLSECFISNQADGFAYPPIIASGISGILLHYQQNNQMLSSGDLILLDIGANYANYKSDITRVFPVSGRFTKRQAAVYEAVLNTLKVLLNAIKPGLSWNEMESICAEQISKGLVALDVLTAEDLRAQSNAYKPFMPHKAAHLIGLDVHETTNEETLKAGMVLAVEPAIYLRTEGIAIRLEENVLVTPDGCRVLSEGIPLEIQEIERMLLHK
jgi:Xaa-Pro aminopeptidase